MYTGFVFNSKTNSYGGIYSLQFLPTQHTHELPLLINIKFSLDGLSE